jgi:hypothetical protein
MKAKFNSLNKSNQSIILSIDILDKSPKKNDYQSFKYNNEELFKYYFYISESKLNFSISLSLVKKKISMKELLVHLFLINQSNIQLHR